MKILKALSPAKINTILHIGEKTADGMHDISGTIQKIALSDEIMIRDTTRFSLVHDTLIRIENNYIYKAYIDLCSTLRSTITPEFVLKKVIPIGYGLGGGSSNYATSMMLMVKYYNLEKEFINHKEILMKKAYQTTSDSLLFFDDSPCLNIKNTTRLHKSTSNISGSTILIIFPSFCNPTGFAYNLYDRMKKNTARYDNDFDVFLKLPQYSSICSLLDNYVNSYSLCGSGSAIWMYTKDIEDKKDLLKSLEIISCSYLETFHSLDHL